MKFLVLPVFLELVDGDENVYSVEEDVHVEVKHRLNRLWNVEFDCCRISE